MAFQDDITDGIADIIAEMGETVSYQQNPYDAEDLSVVWTERTGEPTTALCLLADFPALDSGDTMVPAQGDRITRDGKVYKVADKPVVEMGAATLTLRMIGAV